MAQHLKLSGNLVLNPSQSHLVRSLRVNLREGLVVVPSSEKSGLIEKNAGDRKERALSSW